MATELPPFHPEWLAIEQAMGGRNTLPVESAADSRVRFGGIMSAVVPFLPPPTNDVKTEDIQITSSLKGRIYMPANAPNPLPVGLYIHSGGWYAGSIDAEDHLMRYISQHANIVLFSPDYRLAPENPYPAGLEDCCTAYEFMHAQATKYGGDPSRKFIMGGSAAGNLTLCVGLKYSTQTSGEDNALKPIGLIAAVAATCDPKVLPEEYKAKLTPELYMGMPMIDTKVVQMARDWLNPPDLSDPLYSPLLHPQLNELPALYLPTCTNDPTHQEMLFFYEECKKKGVKQVENRVWVGWPHFFWILLMLPTSKEFLDDWCAWIRKVVDKHRS